MSPDLPHGAAHHRAAELTGRLAAALLGALLLAGCGTTTQDPPTVAPATVYPGDGDRTPASVVRVVDGDTLLAQPTQGGEELRVRLLGIQAPELARNGQPAQCGARSATGHLAGLAPPGTRVTLVADTGEDPVDRYGRTLAYVRTGTRDASRQLVEAGWAKVYVRYPTSATPALRDAQQQARDAGRGIWAGDCPP